MNLLVIDKAGSQAITGPLRQQDQAFDYLPVDVKNDRGAFDLAATANARLRNAGPSLILLNLHLPFAPAQDFYYGIEVLKEIRANSYLEGPNVIQTTHVVVCSTFSLDWLLRRLDAGFFLLASPGTTFQRLPLDLSGLDFAALAEQRILDLGKLKPYFKVTDTTIEERHGHANWWAATRATYHLLQLFPATAGDHRLNAFMKYRNAAVRDAQFLYGDTLEDHVREGRLDRFRKRIQQVREGLAGASGRRRIALIDDQAVELTRNVEGGWAAIYSILLFGDEAGIETIPVTENDEAIMDAVDPGLDCVLLDLMLEPEDKDKRISHMRGARLLRQIKKRYPMLPVVITTASNKAEKRRLLRQLGCDAFWIKEGIEEKLDARESLSRMVELGELVARLTGPEFSLLKRAMTHLEDLKTRTNWWEDHLWDGGQANSPEHCRVFRGGVFDTASQALVLVRSYLQNKLMGEGFLTELEEDFWLSGVITRLATVVEQIHGRDDRGMTTPLILQRGDLLGAALYFLRHNAAHDRTDEPIDFGYFEIFLKGFFCYLANRPVRRKRRVITLGTKGSVLDLIREDDRLARYFDGF